MSNSLLENKLDQLGTLQTHWSPKAWPSKTAMSGRYCALAAVDINQHTAALFQVLCVDNPEAAWTYLPYGPFKTLAEFQTWLQSKISEPDTLMYAILDIKTHSPLGLASYLRITPAHGVIEIGDVHFSKFLKRTPAATEAMYLMMRHVFEDLQYRRYEWKCNALNTPSRKAALRFGFQFEGIFRQHFVFKQRNRDTAWFSILDTEWPAQKHKFEHWLDPNNFTAEGKQIKSLREIKGEDQSG